MSRSVREPGLGAHIPARCLLQRDHFRRWYSSIDPDILVVETSPFEVLPVSTWRISPLSSSCASTIASIVRARPEAIPLFFCCGLHTAPQDTVQGPQGIMRTLIARLLFELDGQDLANLDFTDHRGYRQALAAHEIGTLCHAFTNLIRQWPLNTVIYCIIDGIGWCDRVKWSEDLNLIMNALHELAPPLVRDGRLQPIFKVLVSSPMRSRAVSDGFLPDNRIIVGAGISPIREFPPERYFLLEQTKAEFSQVGVDEDVKDNDYYT